MWPSRGAPIEPVGLKFPVAGSYISVEDRTAPVLAVAPVAAGDEDPSVPEQGRCVLLPALGHRSRRS